MRSLTIPRIKALDLRPPQSRPEQIVWDWPRVSLRMRLFIAGGPLVNQAHLQSYAAFMFRSVFYGKRPA